MCFFVKQNTAYEMRISDWSSDVCSSDLEDAAEMLAVGKNLRLIRQVRPTRINQINAWQPIFRRDFLRAQVLFDRQRIIGAAFHRRKIGRASWRERVCQ